MTAFVALIETGVEREGGKSEVERLTCAATTTATATGHTHAIAVQLQLPHGSLAWCSRDT